MTSSAHIVSRIVIPSTNTAPPEGTRGHFYRTGAWAPINEEIVAKDLEVIQGEIPSDLGGIYIRNTENPLHDSLDGNVNYHPFDGDGLLHQIRFHKGKASYRNRFIQTKGFQAEQEAGRSLWAGVQETVLSGGKVLSERPGWGFLEGAMGVLHFKDTASTDVVVHAGRILATWYMCGEAYSLDLDTLQTLGVNHWSPAEGVSAHTKVDEATGELLFFNYGRFGQNYGVINKNNHLVHYVKIPLPEPMGSPHDICFTKSYTILNDFPRKRFGIIPRYGKLEELRWFSCKPTYVLHWLNAYEEGDTIILDGYFQRNARVFTNMFKSKGTLNFNEFHPVLYRWTFDLTTGATHEQELDDRCLEFGMINQKYAGRKYRYAYSAMPNQEEFLFTGIVKHDLLTGDSQTFHLGEGRYGNETPVAPKLGGQDEDDAYLVTFVTDTKKDRSECIILDAKHIDAGPVATVLLPHRISTGTHSCWVDDTAKEVLAVPAESKL